MKARLCSVSVGTKRYFPGDAACGKFHMSRLEAGDDWMVIALFVDRMRWCSYRSVGLSPLSR